MQPLVAEIPKLTVQSSDLPDGLIIPVDIPSIDDFKKQFEAAVSDDGCHFYIDTSILVWLTQIGKAARAQLKDWIDTVQAPRYLVRDRDAAYGEVFIRRLRSMGIRDRPTWPRSPWRNAYAERLIGSIRRECLDHVVVFGERVHELS
jgi:hypothetical protein